MFCASRPGASATIADPFYGCRRVTKVRPPLTLEMALKRIGGVLSVEQMAAISRRSESQVRAWGDHDKPDSIPMDCAIALDVEYQKAGGVGAPIHDLYALRLDLARQSAFACQAAIAEATMTGVRETAEAIQAQIACTLPSADATDLDRAIRETEEAAASITKTLQLLLAARAQPPP